MPPETHIRSIMHHVIVADLSAQGILTVTGADSMTFLQGQITCDMRSINEQQCRLGAFCNPKGRALAVTLVCAVESGFHLLLPKTMAGPLLEYLRRFVFRSKVSLNDVTDTMEKIQVSGPKAETALEKRQLAIPEQPFTCRRTGATTVIRLPAPVPRFVILAAQGTLLDLKNDPGHQHLNINRTLNILAGIPSVYSATREMFVPQMLNLHWLDGIGFRKGCYTGQEVVARMHYLGKLKRRMYLSASTTPADPGDNLYHNGKVVGNVVDACPWEDGFRLLVVAMIDIAENQTLSLDDEGNQPLTLLPMPYETEMGKNLQ